MKLLTALVGGAWLAMGVAHAADQAAAAPAASQVNTQDPSALVQGAAEAILKDLDANREDYRKNPEKVRQLVDKHLLPHFDVQYAARMVLGKHWKDATADQRERFIKAFYQSMLSNY